MVDAGNLAAGHATPVLTTHLAMSMVFYPLFGITTAAFFVKGIRERAIGSPWFVWIGVIGTVADGVAPVLVGVFGWMEARILFAFMIGIAIWLLLAAVWPAFARLGVNRGAIGSAPRRARGSVAREISFLATDHTDHRARMGRRRSRSLRGMRT